MTGAQYCPVQFFFISHLSPPQMLLAHGTTKGNLQGDLGNTPMMLACSINNCTALRMLVRLSSRDIQPRLTANSAAAEKECSQFVFPLHLPPFFFYLPSFTKAQARRQALRTEQAGPLPHPRSSLCRCPESAGGDPDQRYGENLSFFFLFAE